MAAFVVRKLDPSSAPSPAELNNIPEMPQIESRSSYLIQDTFTGVVTGHDPKGADNSHVGPFWVTTVVAGLLGGEVYIAETNDAEKRIVGCAVWFPPGHSMYDTEAQQVHVLMPLMASFSEELQHWWHAVFLPKYDAFLGSVLGEGTKHNSWHLQTLAVDPQFQRKGAATLLIKEVVNKAQLSGAKLCLEVGTEVNIEIYKRLGFELMPKGADPRCESYEGLDGISFPMWIMTRA
ncbi:hypothetical protein B0H15DRAFT_947911 [Mycena belliarum]|uniref:N-acetyltransferase domain-containing protein n=1 Tax=Mycena belliarum TaxID=1033014 RepID=A0AAD6UB56_9AGAR|nr:hypothetical protein B0H15DRAFT_947911 [Mycena belliae]